jgi:hypothetical protein
MREVTLYIESPDGRQQTITLDVEITVGRTTQAHIAIDDAQLSRVHATIWREYDEIWIADENSTNGTFVNGEKVFGERKLSHRDEILLGTDTRIFIEITAASERGTRTADSAASQPARAVPAAKPQSQIAAPQAAPRASQSKKIPTVPLLAGVATFGIISIAAVALLVANSIGGGNDNNNGKMTTPTAVIRSDLLVPVRVIDPLGGEDPDDLDD